MMRMRSTAVIGLLGAFCVSPSRPGSAQEVYRSSWFATSDGVQLHYFEAGAGPPLVLVTGWTMPAEIWRRQIEHFASTYHVVALDPRGQGQSAKPTEGYQPSRRALDIGELIEHLDSGPAVVVGWSMGAREVLNLTLERGTGSIRAVVLVDSPISLDPDLVEDVVEHQVRGVQGDREQWTRDFVESLFVRPRPAADLESLVRATLSTPTNVALALSANVLFFGPADQSPAMDELDRPVLVVFSSDPWLAAEAERIRQRWPKARVEVIADSGHALFVDQPDAFNRVLAAFLATLSG